MQIVSKQFSFIVTILNTLFDFTVNTPPLQKVKKKSGADVEFDPNPSPVPGMKTIIIRGILSQIEDAIRLINKKTGSKVLFVYYYITEHIILRHRHYRLLYA